MRKLCVACHKEIFNRQKHAKYCLDCIQPSLAVYGNRKRLSVTIDKKVLKRLKSYAIRKDLPVSRVVELAMKKYTGKGVVGSD